MNWKFAIFDAYGTLFDVHASSRKFAKDIGENYSEISEIWRQKQLEYTWTLTLMGEYKNFWELTQEALEFALGKIENKVTAEVKEKMLKAYWELECFPEVPEVLQKLKDENKKVAILSNGSNDMLKAAVDSAKINELVDDIFSVEEIKQFKPTKEVYDMVCKHYNCSPEEVGFHSSNRWDIAGAKKFGFQTIWINRSGQPEEYSQLKPDCILDKLPT